jgi:hypothetical protein
VALVVLGRLAVIAHKLCAPDPVLSTFEEDGFYVLAVSRNLGAGHGSTIDGIHFTNGYQPLWTFLCALPYLVTKSDRAIFTLLYAFATAAWLLAARTFGRLTAGAASSLWALPVLLFLADPDLQGAYVNGMETGLYLTALVLLWRAWPIASPLHLGLALGALAWVRNDAVLFGACLLAAEWRRRSPLHAARAGLVASLTFSPWLVWNYAHTGHIVPQSGLANAVGMNQTPLALGKLVAQLGILGGYVLDPLIPISRLPGGLLAAVALLSLPALAFWAWRRGDVKALSPIAALAAGGVLLLGYYLFISGAVWNYLRYLLPLKLLLLALVARVLLSLPRRALGPVILVLVGLSLNRARVQIDQGVHLAAEIDALARTPLRRVGMFETGRAGYRLPEVVVNIDGKVNLEALTALRAGRLLDFLLASDLEGLYLRDYNVHFLDAKYPDWRRHYTSEGPLAPGTLAVFFRRNQAPRPLPTATPAAP